MTDRTRKDQPDDCSLRLSPRVRLVVCDAPPTPYQGQAIRCARDVWQLIHEEAGMWDRERFLVLAVDGRHRALGLEEISVGTLTATLVHPREVFKGLFLANASAFLLIHNHPSGDPNPSSEDKAVTERLRDAGKLLGIPLLDHIVIAADAFYSFAEMGPL